MAAVEGSYQNLLQGMSQQPAQQRRDGQSGLQVNLTSDPVTNLSKRPPLKYISDLITTSSPANTKFHNYERGDGEDYLISVGQSGEVSVVDTQGNGYPVINNSTSYLTSALPRLDLSFTTVGDISIVSNKNKTVQYTDDVVEEPDRVVSDVINGNHNSIDIRGGAWATTYEVTLRNKVTGIS